jgi:hypothetical protein
VGNPLPIREEREGGRMSDMEIEPTRHRRRSRLIATITSIGVGVAALGMYVTGASSQPAGKVRVCHATASEENPYVLIEVSENSTDFEGHKQHADDPKTNPDGTDRPDLIEGYNVPEGSLTEECEVVTPTTAPPVTAAAPQPTAAAPPQQPGPVVVEQAPPPQAPPPVAAQPTTTG